MSYEERYSGPLPRASELVAYNEAHPHAAEIILEQFAEQGSHRRDLERRIVVGSERRASVGQWIAGALLGGGFAGGCGVALVQPVAGASIVGAVATCGAIVYFLGGRPPSEREDKD